MPVPIPHPLVGRKAPRWSHHLKPLDTQQMYKPELEAAVDCNQSLALASVVSAPRPGGEYHAAVVEYPRQPVSCALPMAVEGAIYLVAVVVVVLP
jgi:hypothetical protein